MTKRNKLLALTLTLTLIILPVLTSCGSLSRILAQPDPPRENNATAAELSRVLRTGESYEGIEIYHGTKDEPYYSPDKKGYLYEDRGWIYLHIEGEPAERGYQHGWLLADYIQLQIDHNKNMLADLKAIDWEYLRENAERMWAHKVSEEYRLELEGIVEGATERGATFDYLDLLVMNGLEELRDCWFPTVQESYYEELAAGLWDPTGKEPEEEEESESSEEQEDAQVAEEEPSEGSAEKEPTEEDEAASSEQQDASQSDSSGSAQESTEEDASNESSQENDEESSTNEDGEESEESEEDASETDENDSESSFIEIAELTGIPDSAVISTLTEPLSIYTKQAAALLATGAATEEGDILLAQNTYAAYADSNFSNVIIDVNPKMGERFTMQAAPGFIHSVGETYSTKSLLIANTQISGFNRYTEEGTPEFLRIRQAAQFATTLDEFTEYMLKEVNGGIASNWLVGELKTGQIMELELGLSFYNVQKTTDGCFISFGGVDDTRILNYETNGTGYFDLRLGNSARLVQLDELIDRYGEKLNTENAQLILADHYDIYTNKTSPSSRTMCAHYDLDNAEHAADSSTEAYMPYGMAGAKVMSTELAKENTILARWSSACGREFNATSYLQKQVQYNGLQSYLYDRPSELWCELAPADG